MLFHEILGNNLIIHIHKTIHLGFAILPTVFFCFVKNILHYKIAG